MMGEEEGVDEGAEADERPFEGDARAFRGELEQQRKPHRQIKEPHRILITGEDSPTPGGEANGLWNQWPLIP